MADSFGPRISQANELLPIIRARLVAAASHHSLPAGFALDLLPIVEDGLVGYEIVPNRATCTYLTIGCDDRGAPTLRERSYRVDPPCSLRLVCTNGRTLSPCEHDASCDLRQRDSVLSDWSSTAEAAWTELAVLFPQHPRHGIEVHDARYACLDEALTIACARLADCDPCIDFCGIPDEAQFGFALTHANGGRGRLQARQPGRWALWWQSPANTLNEEWATARPGIDAAEAWARAGIVPARAVAAPALASPVVPTASSRRPRANRIGDRRHADRRNADPRQAGGNDGERRHGDRRRRERRQSPRGSNAG